MSSSSSIITTESLTAAAAAAAIGHQEAGQIWQDAPLLKGVTKFEALLDVKNILVTGGEGFMYVVCSFVSAYHLSI